MINISYLKIRVTSFIIFILIKSIKMITLLFSIFLVCTASPRSLDLTRSVHSFWYLIPLITKINIHCYLSIFEHFRSFGTIILLKVFDAYWCWLTYENFINFYLKIVKLQYFSDKSKADCQISAFFYHNSHYQLN